MYFDIKLNYETDFQAAAIELESAKMNIDDINADEFLFVPKYRMLNMQIDWKETLINYDDDILNDLYNKLSRLDNIREIILQTTDDQLKDELFGEYKALMKEIIDKKMIENGITFIEDHS